MVTRTLEDNPDLFLAPRYFDDKYAYRLHRFTGEGNHIEVHNINLKSDRLMIYGIEIKDSTLEKLYQSLIFNRKKGFVFVNCYGACHFLVYEKGYCTPGHNVIFDWSQFGVGVPNSLNDSLRKQLEQMNEKLSSAEAEASSTKAALEASKKEVEELKQQLSACQIDRNDKETKLQKMELSKERVTELEEKLSTCTKERQNMEAELQKVQGQLTLVNSELQSTKNLLESSLRLAKESGDHLAIYRNESLAKLAEFQKVQDELSSVHSELCSTKIQLEFSKERVNELEEQLSCSKKESQETVQHQLTLVIHELQNLQVTKSLMESSVKMLQELKDQLSRVQGPFGGEGPIEGTRSRCVSLAPEECNISPSVVVCHDELPVPMRNEPLSIAIEEDIHVLYSNDMSANGARD